MIRPPARHAQAGGPPSRGGVDTAAPHLDDWARRRTEGGRPSGRPSRARAARWWAVHLGVLAVGLVALAVGAGLGLRHYAVEGWGPPAVVGLLLLAGGLVCSGWATLRLLAALRRRWWPLALALLLVATYLPLDARPGGRRVVRTAPRARWADARGPRAGLPGRHVPQQ